MSGRDLESSKLRRERDLYLRLLDLGCQEELEPFLREALALIVDATDVLHGYLELHDERGGPGWWIAHNLTAEQVEGVRHAISRGIIAEAVASGKTIVTGSAHADPRFSALDSVRMSQIEAVLCTPIGAAPPRGVLYLQGQRRPDFFGPDDQSCAEAFARHLAPLADRLLARHREQAAADPTAGARARLRLDGVVGRSVALATVLDQVALVAPLEISVLLTGESGTGKSQLARAIHENSPRAAHPFVEINCAALPEGLIESELFGALPGAHSTATRKVEGKVAAADHGTLFLDEVGDLCSAAQAKLLQLLHAREYYPLGATRSVHADVRVVAATNIDLERAVAEHRFREDLFYRLHVLPVRVPSLEERRDDIPVLAAHFSAEASRRHGLPARPLSPNALRALEAAEWPGNVRQLAHTIEAAVIRALGEGAVQIEAVHLFPATTPPATEPPADETFQEATRRFQAELLRQALEANGWSVIETARRLDVARSHVYKLIGAFGLERGRK
jgi:Nif-specific regulatory protein